MPGNIILNGNFQNGLNYWEVNYPELVEVVAKGDLTFARDHVGNMLLQQTVSNIVPGRKYIASCSARVPGTNNHNVWFGCHSGEDIQSTEVTLSEGFKKYRVEFTPKEESLEVYLVIEPEGPEKFYVEITDISLIEESVSNKFF